MFLQDDMWAIGAILAELFMLTPLFPGESEMDQLYKICAVLGTPDSNVWPEGMNFSRSISFTFFQFPPAILTEIIPNASHEAIDLILQLCSWDPKKRPTAEQSLQHPFFHVGTWIPFPLEDPFSPEVKQSGSEPKLELSLWDFGTESDDCFLSLTLTVKPSVPNIDELDNVSPHPEEDFLFCTGYQDHSAPSVFWPIISSDHSMNNVSAVSPLPSSYTVSSQTSFSAVGVPKSSPFSFFPSLQGKNLLENHHSFGPISSISSPIQDFHFME